LRNDLTRNGYKVIVVSESATEILSGGIVPDSELISMVDFQKYILEYQLAKESIYEKAAKNLPENIKVVIIYDRGLMDNKAYVSNKEFDEILKEFNLKEIELMDRYDLVIHLVTSAYCKDNSYTPEGNPVRKEDSGQAQYRDTRTMNAWAGHNRISIVEPRDKFEDKINDIIDRVHQFLGLPISLRIQKKYLIDLKDSHLSFLNDENATTINIEQTYLETSPYEKRLRKRTYKGESTHELTVQKKGKKGKSILISTKHLTSKDYQKLLDLYPNSSTLQKARTSFMHNRQYFNLDVFPNNSCTAILEVYPTDENGIVDIPGDIKVIKDVTNDPDYQTANIASTLLEERQLEKLYQ
jgi:hypothetical protein